MKAIRCSNGHWYDSETYNQCPHCGQPNAAVQSQSVSTTSKSKRGFFGFLGKTSTTSVPPTGNGFNQNYSASVIPASVVPAASTPVNYTDTSYVDEADKKTEILCVEEPMSLTHEEVTEQFFADIDDGKTRSLFEARDRFEDTPADENTHQQEMHSVTGTMYRQEVSPVAENVYRQEVSFVAEDVSRQEMAFDAGAPTHEEVAFAAGASTHEEVAFAAETATHEEMTFEVETATHEEVTFEANTATHEEINFEIKDAFDEGISFDIGDAFDQKDTPETENGPTNEVVPQENVTSEPLAAAVQRVSAMDEGKTLSYFNAMTNQNDTAGATVAKKATNPVVGWLIAVSGVHLGESFQLYAGKNAIGRGEGNKVVLALDQSVSRENHATIIYEPKRREFYLQSGNSDGLVYLNDSFVSGMQLLKAKDMLEIGSSKLLFVPLCGAEFSWEQYM